MNAAIINSRNEVVFSATIPESVREIEVAGTVTADGYPVNRRTYRVSRSKKNLAKAARLDFSDMLIHRQHGNISFYTY